MSLPDVSTESRTRRWAPDEYCRVDSMRCAYTFSGSVLVVRLPGGRCASVAELRQRGHIVKLPARIRRGDA
jgi:hypothetical protein